MADPLNLQQTDFISRHRERMARINALLKETADDVLRYDDLHYSDAMTDDALKASGGNVNYYAQSDISNVVDAERALLALFGDNPLEDIAQIVKAGAEPFYKSVIKFLR